MVNEGVNDPWIEMGSPPLLDHRDGLISSHRGPVAAVGEEGVEDIGDRRDPSL